MVKWLRKPFDLTDEYKYPPQENKDEIRLDYSC